MSWLSKKIKKAKKGFKKIKLKNVAGKISGALKKLSNIPVIGSAVNTMSGGLIGLAADGLKSVQKGIDKAKIPKLTGESISKIAGGLANLESNNKVSQSSLSSSISNSPSDYAGFNNNIIPKRSFWSFLGKTRKKRR